MNKARRTKQYGLTPDQWDQMVKDQEGRCLVCGRLPPQGSTLHTDHCHRTSVVRGLLCRQCNLTLGMVDESPTTLRALADYIEKFL